MRVLALLTLVSLSAQAQGNGRFDRFCDRTSTGRSDRGFDCGGAFFEAFPSSGAGTNGVCSTTAPTGSKGETLTFTRASSAMCTKTATGGFATSGIANGDLVLLSNDQPRVEYSNGKLAILEELGRTNFVLRSQEFDNAAWTKTGTGVAAPTVTADFAVAPDGTTTAERIQFAALVAGAQQSIIQSAPGTFGGATRADAIYLKGNGTSGTLDFWGGTTPITCVTCSYVAATWTRCVNLPAPTVTGTWALGNDDATAGTGCAGGTSRPAADVLVWGGSAENGAYPTSYIPTAAASVARVAENPYFAKSVPTATGVCTAATVELPSLNAPTAGSSLFAPALSTGAPAMASPYVWPYASSSGGTSINIDGSGSSGAPAGGGGAQNMTLVARYIARNTGALWQTCKDGSCGGGASGAWSGSTYTHIKLTSNAGAEGSALWSLIVVDPDWTRCQ